MLGSHLRIKCFFLSYSCLIEPYVKMPYETTKQKRQKNVQSTQFPNLKV